jgi:tyrosyl-tRNA synthetase
MLTDEEISHNISCFKKQMAYLVDFSKEKAMILDNSQWLRNLNYIDFLREIGIHFSINRMLAAECYKQRMENGLSLFELNYMVMQSYDFLFLNRHYGCSLQLGGDDQWSNIIGGVELIRRIDGNEAYALTSKLLTTSSGKKMGKTEKGAVWLDPQKTSPYEFYQYWRNVNDADVIRCLKMLTFLPLKTISTFEKLEGSEINKAKEILAFEVTKLVHGQEEAVNAQSSAKALFEQGCVDEAMPRTEINREIFKNDGVLIVDLLAESGIIKSKSEVRRLIEQNGISIDGKKVENITQKLSEQDFSKGHIIVRKGKKSYYKLFVK